MLWSLASWYLVQAINIQPYLKKKEFYCLFLSGSEILTTQMATDVDLLVSEEPQQVKDCTGTLENTRKCYFPIMFLNIN